MSNLIVVDNPKSWPLDFPGAPVVAARAYLTDPRYSEMKNLKVFNLCRSYRYQSTGYYVSLLAMARGHKPLPAISNIQDMKSLSIARIIAGDLDELTQRSLRSIKSDTFDLSVYFGRNVAKRYDDLAARLFGLFRAPLLRAEFQRAEGGWELKSVRAIAAHEIPASHHEAVAEAAGQIFARARLPARRAAAPAYDLAVLHNPQEPNPPSNPKALERFASEARKLKMGVEFITREDFGRLGEFDALFIRETTSVHHHTYRFARRGAAEGLVVIDDPDSIVRCTNKVYLAELLTRYGVPTPRSVIVHRDNRAEARDSLGMPCILKQPDGSFSQGVVKAEDHKEFDQLVDVLLDKSDMIIAQEFVPTEFDWRIGVLDRQPLYACKYYMAGGHWQIAQSGAQGAVFGKVEAVPLELTPRQVLQTAVRAARLIGDGLYGVDLKLLGDKACVIEVNDNPTIEAGDEDHVLKGELYARIMRVFLARIQEKKDGLARGQG